MKLEYDVNDPNPQDAVYNQFEGYLPVESIDLPQYTFVVPKQYKLDVDKIQALEDIKAVLRAFDIRVPDNVPCFEEIKHLLETNPQ